MGEINNVRIRAPNIMSISWPMFIFIIRMWTGYTASIHITATSFVSISHYSTQFSIDSFHSPRVFSVNFFFIFHKIWLRHNIFVQCKRNIFNYKLLDSNFVNKSCNYCNGYASICMISLLLSCTRLWFRNIKMAIVQMNGLVFSFNYFVSFNFCLAVRQCTHNECIKW